MKKEDFLRTIELTKEENNKPVIRVIDQRKLPHRFEILDLRTTDDVAFAIRDMVVRGAPLIGATAACGMYLAAIEAEKQENPVDYMRQSAEKLISTRPTAVNLTWAVDEQLKTFHEAGSATENLRKRALAIIEQDVQQCSRIGDYGLPLIEEIYQRRGSAVNILTHCNAGYLACIEWGTATAPIYKAKQKGIDVHVWVDETRPRNQGAGLTAWELGQQGVPYTVITDNAGGHLMQQGLVDMVITGTDRTTYRGDVANKIGTYLKALAAFDNDIPFYVALPPTTIDWETANGSDISIEERDENEVKYIKGSYKDDIVEVLITPENANVFNVGFDVTPARLITGLITDRGICKANEQSIRKLFPEKVVERAKQ